MEYIEQYMRLAPTHFILENTSRNGFSNQQYLKCWEQQCRMEVQLKRLGDVNIRVHGGVVFSLLLDTISKFYFTLW